MKIAIYIEEGITQLVLTPQGEYEEKAIAAIREQSQAEIKRGSFYKTQGGWDRQGDDNDSLIIRFVPTVDK